MRVLGFLALALSLIVGVTPLRSADLPRFRPALPGAGPGEVPMVGHAHLDVAWLWTYADTRRKALRTFGTAAAGIPLISP